VNLKQAILLTNADSYQVTGVEIFIYFWRIEEMLCKEGDWDV
jgi:hypothetical protein